MDFDKINRTIKELSEPLNKGATNIIDKPTKELGEGIGNLFWLIFSPIQKARMVQEVKINAYVDSIKKELEKVPDNKLVEPPLSIVGPALEASKYHIDHEEIRDLFAKLIASSANLDKQEMVHPSFIEVIKQLSPFDAFILRSLVDDPMPIANIIAVKNLDNNAGRYVTRTTWKDLYSDVIPFPNINLNNCDQYIASVQNLSRLSLLKIDYASWELDDEIYDSLTKILNEAKDEYSNVKRYPMLEGYTIDIKRGIWEFTTLGQMFIHCCLSDPESIGQQP